MAFYDDASSTVVRGISRFSWKNPQDCVAAIHVGMKNPNGRFIMLPNGSLSLDPSQKKDVPADLNTFAALEQDFKNNMVDRLLSKVADLEEGQFFEYDFGALTIRIYKKRHTQVESGSSWALPEEH